MNEFLKRIGFKDSYNRRALQPPLEGSFSCEAIPEFIAQRYQTCYSLQFHFNQEAWVDGDKTNDPEYLMQTKILFLKAVHKFIFGATETALFELEMHLHNQDYEKALKTLQIAKQTINGDSCDQLDINNNVGKWWRIPHLL